MTSPAYLDAIHDHELAGLTLGIYLRLYHDHLDAWEYRVIKQIVLATEMRVSQSMVEKAVALLRARGYLEYGPRGFGLPRQYRLVHSRMRAMTAE